MEKKFFAVEIGDKNTVQEFNKADEKVHSSAYYAAKNMHLNQKTCSKIHILSFHPF